MMLSLISLSSLASYAFTTSITPGPNNLMLLHSGMHFGIKRTLAHAMGVSLGHAFLTLACCLGISSVMAKLPILQTFLKFFGFAYMLYLTYQLYKNGSIPKAQDFAQPSPKTKAAPMTFFQAALFQWVNPKGWVMSLTVATVYLPKSTQLSQTLLDSLIVAAIFLCINAPCIQVWVHGGATLRRLIHHPRLGQAINWVIVLMTLYSAIAIWF